MFNWKIEHRSFHCVHSSGLTAFVDPNPIGSGAIRCVGPFGADLHSPESVFWAMLELELEVQKTGEPEGSYAVWGAYKDYAEFEPHRFQILGNEFGFVPNFSQRIDALFRTDVPIWKDEWDFVDNVYSHKSGIEFNLASYLIDATNADVAVLHPEFGYEMLRQMAAQLYRRIRRREPDRTFAVDLSFLRWNRCEPRTGIST